ncbi:thiamine diphosphokinase [Leuconostoc rapi]|uniref:thiamine diphosphokinase n=1 Tax=Leuconostoc rapi TaxID=1406906 RepID=UPI00195A0A6C|nr:thiamine diphosphokinase [Leuconostoc rapi]MBM7434796.1 thiamine pyrophosphokinase [Leuconostoc rapi]
MQINILAGGDPSLWPEKLFDQPGFWIGADRGAWRLYQRGIPMLLAVGDFDSLNQDELHVLESHLQKNEIIHVKAEKDETDTELALLYAQTKKPDNINIFGATGGRLDHLLSNLWLLADPKFESIVEKTHIIDNVNDVSYLASGSKTIHKISRTKYLGFMPLTEVTHFKIIDAKYTLTLKQNVYKMWSSNEFVSDTVHVSFDTGILMVTQTRDRT